MEENMEQKPSMFHDPLALKATEKSLYDVIGEKYPGSPTNPLHIESPDCLFGSSSEQSTNSNTKNSIDSQWIVDPDTYGFFYVDIFWFQEQIKIQPQASFSIFQSYCFKRLSTHRRVLKVDHSVSREFQFTDISLRYDIMDSPFCSNVNDMSDSMERESAEDNDLCYAVLRYINQVLMDDDSEDKADLIQDSTLHAAEKSFYEILDQKYPSSPYQHLLHEETRGSSDDSVTHCCSGSSNRYLNDYKSVESSFTADGPLETLVNVPLENQSGWEFNGGIEEINSMLLSGYGGDLYFEGNRLTPPEVKETVLEKSLLTGRKNLHREESDLEEGRSNKYLAVYPNEFILHEMFDKVLSLNYESALDHPQQNWRGKGFIGELIYNKKCHSKREAIDMRCLLTQCMQSVGDNDHRNAAKLLKQIRLHSSPSGDGTRRLAHYFANSLEARLVGAVIPEYNALWPLSDRTMSDADILRAYKLCLSSFPFMETSYFFVAQMIMDLAEKATSIHVIDFGITYGLQLIHLIQQLSARPGGPPMLRITGINLPQTGFQPGARAKETGLRLANYCERFHVPFKYNGIEQKWETISVEDLQIEKGEVLLVIFQLMYLFDDTAMNSPRDSFLNLIRRINPAIFIHKIPNWAFNSPYFVSRFREALFFYSALFDMLDANVPRENWDRLVLEREIWGNEILNVVACEGRARVIRPETYKQWQIRTLRAGFRQLPLSQKIMKKIKAKVKSCYHKDFFVDEAGEWLLEGWKGKVMYAISCWKPA
ncbi:GRAS family transcription factor [Actinidia rufa]|uniref:GRAS family transcription factor n=1 Tax=Actinidia rufa TaxID=165716 RepID=A0A7J0H4Q7_9ERIC|nr:GRAS family transcription factor [Actinidia rufa]